MIKTASLHNLYASRITEVISVYGRQIERLLIEFTKKNQDPKVDQMIIKNLDGAYSETYKNLTSAFYLKF
jgi:tRNA1Val (adenine37-N6)-methyltransferase